MPLMPKRVKYRKTQRGSRKGTASRNLRIDFGEFGLQTLERAWITNTQIEAARVALTRNMKRKGKLWIRIFPDKSVTARPPETRMGKGKGQPEYWVATVRAGQHFIRAGWRDRIGRARISSAGGGQVAGANEVFNPAPRRCGLTNYENQRDIGNEHGRAADQEARFAPGEFASALAAAERPARTAEPVTPAAPGCGPHRDGAFAARGQGGRRKSNLWPKQQSNNATQRQSEPTARSQARRAQDARRAK